MSQGSALLRDFAQDLFQALPHHRVIVSDKGFDHEPSSGLSGIRTVTVVPWPGAPRISISPSNK